MEEVSLADLVAKLKPRLVVELGTGDGYTASAVMSALPEDGRLITVNWPNPPSGDNPWRYLERWMNDSRLTLIFGDTRDREVIALVPDNIDILYIDSTHEYACAALEWDLYRPKLRAGAVVLVDDLNHNDMHKFWNELPYEKIELRHGEQGMFTYDP